MGKLDSNPDQRFHHALETLIEQVKQDRSVLAAILCGSLSYDTVWEKSDIDLVLVTIDDKKTGDGGVSLNADGIYVHAMLMPRAEFRKLAEGALRNSFVHSFVAKGRLLYTHDDTIATLCSQLHTIGDRDTQIQLLGAAGNALRCLYKAHKWFRTRGDLEYTAVWILYAATSLAKIEVLSARMLADREVLPQAMRLNPAFFKTIYTDLLNSKKTRKNVEAALAAMDEYLASRTKRLFAPVFEHLREVGEARSCSELEHFFERNFGFPDVTAVCEYLADQGLLGKAGVPVRLTKRSNIEVEELAFYYVR